MLNYQRVPTGASRITKAHNCLSNVLLPASRYPWFYTHLHLRSPLITSVGENTYIALFTIHFVCWVTPRFLVLPPMRMCYTTDWPLSMLIHCFILIHTLPYFWGGFCWGSWALWLKWIVWKLPSLPGLPNIGIHQWPAPNSSEWHNASLGILKFPQDLLEKHQTTTTWKPIVAATLRINWISQFWLRQKKTWSCEPTGGGPHSRRVLTRSHWPGKGPGKGK